MNSSNLRSIFVLLAALSFLCAGAAQAEERERPHFYQPGAGYEKEPTYTFTGVIRKLPEKGKVGIWVIDDRLIVVTSMSQIHGTAAVGASVTVKGVLQDTDFLALTIEVAASKD
ncbi:hypothetical protein GCAAIG_01270 [Candidatus Electronema halotolerans]